MKILKLLFAAMATLVATAAAKAADMVVPRTAKTPGAAVVPMPAFSWTGCHAGIHGGWGRGRHIVEASRSSGGIAFAESTDHMHTDGGLFGGQIGCDLDFANGWGVGLGGDIAATHLTGKVDIQDAPFNSGSSIRADAQWLASATGRLGFSGLLPQTLIYAKGGAAWVHEKYRFDSNAVALDGEFKETRNGWTVGGGLAWSFTRNWSVFAEYNHYDFRNAVFSKSFSAGIPFLATGSMEIRPGNIDTVKVGLNYRFGG